jgi:hypothetical protein
MNTILYTPGAKKLLAFLIVVSFSCFTTASYGQLAAAKSKKQERKEERQKKKEAKAKRLAAL